MPSISSLPRLALRVGAGAAFCAVVGSLIWVQSQPASAQPERAAPAAPELISPESAGFLTIRVSEMWDEPSLKDIRELLVASVPVDQLEKELGITIGDIETITVLWPNFPGDGGTPVPGGYVVRMKKPYDKTGLLTKLKASSPQDAKSRKLSSTKAMTRAASSPRPVTSPMPYPGKDKMPPGKDGFGTKDGPGTKDGTFKVPEGGFKEAPVTRKELPPATGVPEKGATKGVRPVTTGAIPVAKKDEYKPDLKAPYYYLDSDSVLYCLDSRTLLLCNFSSWNATAPALLGQLLKPATEGPLTKAIAQSKGGKHAVSGGFDMEKFRGMFPKSLPRDLMEFKAFLESQSVDFTLDIGKELTATIRMQSKGAADVAEAAKESMAKMRTQLKQVKQEGADDPEFEVYAKMIDIADAAMKTAKITAADGTATMVMTVPMGTAVSDAIAAAKKAISLAAGKTIFSNNLKQVGLAMHGFHDTIGAFPFPGLGEKGPVRGPKDTVLLSWRVAILPFIEQQALYAKFKLDEPWDSEHNKKLIPLMPKIYAMPPGHKNAGEGMTCWQTFSGPQGVTTGMSFRNITDGTSNTIAVAESANPVIWTKPEDMPFDAKGELPKVGASPKSGFWVLMFDGSVSFKSAKVSEKTLRNAIMPNDGSFLGADWYNR